MYTRQRGDTLLRTTRSEEIDIGYSSFDIKAAFRDAFDRVLAFCALLFFLPFLVIVTIALLVTHRRPVLFEHRRIGKGGQHFACLKFRTMSLDADEQLKRLLESDPIARAEWDAHQKLEDDPRVTCLGRFLRKSSLDELPQLWNVIRGEMALVGPRPIVDDEVHHYGDRFSDYASVKPGITGLWQVSGRSDTTYEERVALDMDYIENQSFLRDLSILLRTVKVVFAGKGAV